MKKYLTRTNIGWLLTGMLTFLLVMSAIGKLTGAEDVVEMFTKNGIADWITIVAIGELASILLFAYPKTKTIGTFLLSSYFGGAIMLHMSHGEAFAGPAVILVFIWVVAWVRRMPWFEMD